MNVKFFSRTNVMYPHDLVEYLVSHGYVNLKLGETADGTSVATPTGVFNVYVKDTSGEHARMVTFTIESLRKALSADYEYCAWADTEDSMDAFSESVLVCFRRNRYEA